MKPKVLVTGTSGQLGSEIHDLCGDYDFYDFIFAGRDVLDLSETENIRSYFNSNRFDFIINCGAYTLVDKAEIEKELAKKINTQAVEELSLIAKRDNSKLIHISTDYVFNGQSFRPYIESDKTDPINSYGKSKLDGEEALIKINPPGSIIIRTSWVYSSYGKNFVKTMLKLGSERESLKVIFDQVGTPTYARDLARSILSILGKLNHPNVEIFHYSNEGVCSWYDFAIAIFNITGISCKVDPIETVEYPTPAKRPHYSLLNKAKIKRAFGIEIPYWKDSLFQCLEKIKGEI